MSPVILCTLNDFVFRSTKVFNIFLKWKVVRSKLFTWLLEISHRNRNHENASVLHVLMNRRVAYTQHQLPSSSCTIVADITCVVDKDKDMIHNMSS